MYNNTVLALDCSRKCFAITTNGVLISWGYTEEDLVAITVAKQEGAKVTEIKKLHNEKFTHISSRFQTVFLNATEGWFAFGYVHIIVNSKLFKLFF